MFEKEITFDRFIRGLMVVAGLAFAIYILNLLSAVLLPFFVAWFLAYMIYPTVKFFQYKLRLRNRILCIILTLLLILAGIVGFFYLIIPPAVDEFVRFRTVIDDLIRVMGNSELAHSVESFLTQNFDQNVVVQLIRENNVMEAVKVAINQLWNLLSQTFDLILTLVGVCMMFLYLFFLILQSRSTFSYGATVLVK